MWKWAIIAGLIGYLILQPAVMISGRLVMEWNTPFSLGRRPWNITFTLGAALSGGLYGRLKAVEQLLRDSPANRPWRTHCPIISAVSCPIKNTPLSTTLSAG